jgi:hypothetical protein
VSYPWRIVKSFFKKAGSVWQSKTKWISLETSCPKGSKAVIINSASPLYFLRLKFSFTSSLKLLSAMKLICSPESLYLPGINFTYSSIL